MAVNVMEAFPGEVDCCAALVPSLLQPSIMSEIRVERVV
jgi:hypothetical protein